MDTKNHLEYWGVIGLNRATFASRGRHLAMDSAAGGLAVPTYPQFDWRRLSGWFDAARQLLARSTGSSGSSPTRPRETSGAALQLEELMIDHAEAAYRVALSVTRNPHLAEDVTQDAMLKAWQALPTYRGDAPLRNWVLRITHNTAISALRKRREVLADPAELPEREAAQSVERQAHGRMALSAFEEALNELDDLTRSIVVLREIESLSYDEIAELLDIALPTVKTRLLRARRQLSATLEGWRA